MLSRRSFLVSAGAGLATGSLVSRMAFASHHEKIPLGIQLWTVKDEAAKDLEGTLRKVYAAGFREIEFAGFYGKSAAEIGALLKGIGFSLVWLNDKDGKLWMCDADSDGNVYSYSLVTQDLLEGAGPEMLGLTEADFGQVDPQETAQKVCAAYLTQGGKVLATAPDGYEQDPGFAVFIKANQDGGTYLCNATSDAKIWAFEAIGDPLSLEQQVS